MRRAGLLALSLLASLGIAQATHPPTASGDGLTVGMLAYREPALVRERWSPVIAALNARLPDGLHVDLRVESFEGLQAGLRTGQFDLVFTNPVQYLTLQDRGLIASPLATLVRRVAGARTTRLGGVIIRSATADGPFRLVDIADERIAVIGRSYLGGFMAGAEALAQRGVDWRAIEYDMTSETHDEVVATVLNGDADVGFVRTGVVEALTSSGALDRDQLRVIDPVQHADFPFPSSTQLYPEWPIATAPGFPDETLKRLAAALYSVDEAESAMTGAGIHGFTLPADYSVILGLMRDLRLPPFDNGAAIDLRDVWERYQVALVVAGVLMVAILALLVLVFSLYRHQRALQARSAHLYSRVQSIIDGTRAGTWEWHVPSGKAHFNERWAEMIGYTLAELEPTTIETWTERTHPDDLAEAQKQLKRHFDGEEPFYEVVVRMRHRAGHWVWIYDRGRVSQWTADGRPEWVTGTHIDDSARHRLTEAERDRFTRFEEFARNAPGVLFQFRIDADGTVSFPFISERIEKLAGVSAAAVMNDAQCLFNHIAATDRPDLDAAVAASRQALTDFQINCRLMHPEHGVRWVHAQSTPSASRDGSVTWHGYLDDVTDEQAAQDRLRQAAEIFEATREGILVTDEEHRITEINSALQQMLGYSIEALRGHTPACLYEHGTADPQFHEVVEALEHGPERWQGDLRMRCSDGSLLDVDCFVTTIRNESLGTVRHLALLHDISERLEYQAQLERLASFDALTGLPNRRLLTDRLDQAIAEARRTGEALAVCMLDLDGFKPVNDRFGHETGDRVLRVIATRLVDTLRDEDTVARLGGDEFVLVIRGYRRDPKAFQRILEKLGEPIWIDGVEAPITVGGSLGVSVYDIGQPSDGDQLLRQADQAAYRAKALGGHQFVYFHAMSATHT
jgi:diguanylate cyclase (GGDEF)-like protein/PAS domain S-box-containing protein